jgi:hypothetical protein
MSIPRNLGNFADNVDTNGQVSLTTGVTGTLPVANGGSGSTATPTAGGIGYGTGTANAYTAAGTAGQALLSNGASAPTWGDVAAFASGTVMLFVQTSAPTGWTKSTAHDNKALRIVSGSASTGGSVAFTTAFASQTPSGSVSVSGSVGSTTLSTSEIPSHTHTFASVAFSGGTSAAWAKSDGTFYTNYTTNATGGGGSHNHSFSGSGSFSGSAINLAVSYVDTIIATKN